MDLFDRRILSELQKDGRLSLTELSKRVGLSLSPCHRRVKNLEESGAIQGYQAQINPASLGLEFSSLVFITLKEITQPVINDFETSVMKIPEVTEAYRLFGNFDFMLEVTTEDLQSYQELYDRRLAGLPGVQRLTSTLIMKNIVRNKAFSI